MQYWSRDDTRHWIDQMENRVEDIEYYLNKTIEWCEENCVFDNRRIFLCSFMAMIWVAHMRNELISYKELFEILGLEDMIVGEDKVYDLGPEYQNLEHIEVLRLALKNA